MKHSGSRSLMLFEIGVPKNLSDFTESTCIGVSFVAGPKAQRLLWILNNYT